MLGFQRRGVRRCEYDTLLPKPGPLPHTSQTEATGSLHLVVVKLVIEPVSADPVVEGYPTTVPCSTELPCRYGACRDSGDAGRRSRPALAAACSRRARPGQIGDR